MAPMEYTLMSYTQMQKAWFYERLFFEVVIVMLKANKPIINDTMSVKISFMV